ncbi:HelD family protein [Propioniciclava coleopterorum]|uniref:HelD family protein n=1 Tax=Propioniciclava coleopterorum TaxID=2714937 RepID=UPI001FEC4BE6|nr:UvrD-helicase domain-containing protein [Propioniciclava coleopterorum]
MTEAELLAHELATEQAHVDAVYARLDQATDTARNAARSGQNLFRSERDTWMREEDGTALFERDAFSYQAARRLAELDAEHEGLVFGRLDLDDPEDREVRYIGRIGVRDDEYEPLVIDWRARAAEPFYRATPQRPMDVVRRRVLRCRNDRVVGIEDDLLDAESNVHNLPVVGEGALMASLARARGTRMRDIVATIQSEQDEAIRADYPGVTVISGGPGTGKTVVALHRAAYLLYSHRRRFERGGVLVVGPGPVFMNYIERVLPSLGEDSVTLRSIGSIVSDVLPGVASDTVDDADTAVVKGSLKMVTVLRTLVNLPLDLTTGLAPSVRVTIKGEVLSLSADQVARIRAGILSHQRVNLARESAQKAVVAALAQQVPEETDVEADQVPDMIADQAAFRTFMDAWWPSLSAPQVLRRLADPAVTARAAEGVLRPEQQRLLSESYAREAPWTVADTALLDELVAILGPVPSEPDAEQPVFIEGGESVAEFVTTSDVWERKADPDLREDTHETYAHVLVDEAQDVTPMQWRMLRRRGSQASWTVVGDLAQSSWPDLEEVGRAVRELIGNAPHRDFRLSVNYRSPAEVFNLAKQVVEPHYPDADLPRAVRSTGHEPELLTTTEAALVADLADVIDRLTDEVGGTVGVIAPPSRREALRGALQRRLATRMNPANLDRILFPSPLEAKGLEYDGVVVVDPDAIVAESPGGIRVLYVALTRPTQRLVTLDVGRPGAWRQGVAVPAPELEPA